METKVSPVVDPAVASASDVWFKIRGWVSFREGPMRVIRCQICGHRESLPWQLLTTVHPIFQAMAKHDCHAR